MAFKNKQGISEIIMRGKTHLFCRMGDDYYTANVIVTVNTPNMIPDYVDISTYLQGIDGDDKIIEELVDGMFEFVREQVTTAESIEVKVTVDDAHSHYPVEVIKRG